MPSSPLDRKTAKVLVIMPGDPGEALAAMRLISALRQHLPGHSFAALCAPQIKSLARCCTSLDPVISLLPGDEPLRRDWQQAGQLMGLNFNCALVLNCGLHMQLIPRLARIDLRLGWKSHYSRWLLHMSLERGDWQGLWRILLPEQPWPDVLPEGIMQADTSASRSATMWLGMDKRRTLIVLGGDPGTSWRAELESLADGYNLAWLDKGSTASASDTAAAQARWKKVELGDPRLLAALPGCALALCQGDEMHQLAAAFGVPRLDFADSPERLRGLHQN